MVELLLAHGADPNSYLDSSGNATYAAKTKDIRAILMAAGGTLDTYDLVWLGEDDEVVRRVAEDPASANSGCGGVFTAAATNGKTGPCRETACSGGRVPGDGHGVSGRTLWEDPEILRLLLASGNGPEPAELASSNSLARSLHSRSSWQGTRASAQMRTHLSRCWREYFG
jgi:hypothetical protein